MSDDTIVMEGIVLNPATLSQTDGSSVQPVLGRQQELLTSIVHSKNHLPAYRGNRYGANVTAVTIPVQATTLVSVFSLYNPVGSGIFMELDEVRVGQVLATTVVDAVGLYFSASNLAAAGTFTTKGTIQSAQIGSGLVGKGQFFSAYTHSGTPVRVAMVGSFGATTDAGATLPSRSFDGGLLIPEGCVVSVAMTTAAGTASGLDVEAWWNEWPK